MSPKKKNTPKSHSLSQAKTSELPPTAEDHFVVNYSIRAHYKARGQMNRTCILTFSEAWNLTEHTCVEDRQACWNKVNHSPVDKQACWNQVRQGPVSSTDHWFWLLTQIITTLLPCRVDSRFAPSQWETSLQNNTVSYWLGANLESALPCTQYIITP